jgi:hypothetical protein
MSSLNNIFKGDLRFNQIAISTKTVGTGLIVGLTECGQHYNPDVFQGFGVTEDIEHLKSTNARHHDVGNNKVRRLGLRHS